MILSRDHLVPLLNALYRTGTTRLSISHPSEAIDELLSIELGDPEASTVEFTTDLDEYANAHETVYREHGQNAFDSRVRVRAQPINMSASSLSRCHAITRISSSGSASYSVSGRNADTSRDVFTSTV